MKRYKILSWAAVIISFALLVLPRIVPDLHCSLLTKMGTPMPSYYAYQGEFVITLLAVIISASLQVLRTAEARSIVGFFIALLGISMMVLLQPWAIGLCAEDVCSDYHNTGFWTTLGAILLTVDGAGIAWLTRKGE